jgi:uncharacterized phiE125 gp8 family phage protein
MKDTTSRLRIIAPPTSEPVSLSEAKLFLRIDHTAEDTVISRAITTAREAAEQWLKLALLPQSLELAVGCHGQQSVALPIGPARAIDAVTLITRDEQVTEWNETHFVLSANGCMLHFDVPLQGRLATIAYEAALADHANALPVTLKQGILHHVAALLENREGIASMPAASLACYQPYRRMGL